MISKTKEPQVGGGGVGGGDDQAFYLFLCLAMCLFQIVVFEVNALTIKAYQGDCGLIE